MFLCDYCPDETEAPLPPEWHYNPQDGSVGCPACVAASDGDCASCGRLAFEDYGHCCAESADRHTCCPALNADDSPAAEYGMQCDACGKATCSRCEDLHLDCAKRARELAEGLRIAHADDERKERLEEQRHV